MHIKESPNIKGFERRYSFRNIEWIACDTFEDIVNDYEIHPYLSINQDDDDDGRMFVGKAYIENVIPKVELIGVVCRNLDGRWEIKIPFDGAVCTLTKNFFVLNIPDRNAIEWVATKLDCIPQYALRGTLDVGANEFLYIGRVVVDRKTKPIGEYYDPDEKVWFKYDGTISSTFGKAQFMHKQFYAPFNDREIAFQKFEILCLKPTPASLNILSRNKLRQLVNYDDKRIYKLYSRLPGKYFKILQYPNYLYSGDYLLPNEKLISTCGKYEIKVNEQSCFVLKERFSGKEKVVFHIDVIALFLHSNHIIACRKDHATVLKYNLKNDRLNPKKYKIQLVVSEDDHTVNYKIELLNKNKEVTNTSNINIFTIWNSFQTLDE